MFLLYLYIPFTSTISIYIINSPSLLKTHDATHSSLLYEIRNGFWYYAQKPDRILLLCTKAGSDFAIMHKSWNGFCYYGVVRSGSFVVSNFVIDTKYIHNIFTDLIVVLPFLFHIFLDFREKTILLFITDFDDVCNMFIIRLLFRGKKGGDVNF